MNYWDDWYVLLPDKTVRPAVEGEWSQPIEERRVGRDKAGDYTVSTVFLGLDHQFGDGPPLLFETMVFGGDSEECERYTTYEEAVAGHRRWVKRLSDPLARLEDIRREILK